MHTSIRRALSSLAVAVIASSAVLVGCGDPEVAKPDVEKAAMKTLSDKVGRPSPPITCPGPLKAKVGATLVCSMPIDGKDYDVTIAVASLENSSANFTVEVADKPRG